MDVDQLSLLAARAAVPDPLLALDAVGRLRAEVERTEAVLVRRARTSGATWLQIATALGVSKQAVHKKHGGRRLFGTQP
ncbi:hypothetical protein [Actinotalea sp. K2]|uniref:hypothetical protein n=1 Tax=Actinotalea sp. K2 TaxID=2939438 RepID=UPI002017BF22|nr:hypothetical protein [Actinotalea sp. K2]MCL3861242.1 hypothetical protein [Actinotalea sp. K2]